MKFLLTALLVTSTLVTSPKVQAMEIVAIVVGGSVSTIALSGTAAVLGGARFKTEIYQEALDVVATGDETLMSSELAQILDDIKASNPEIANVDDLELLEAIINGEIR